MNDITTPSASVSDAKWWGNSLTVRGALLSAGCSALPALGTLVGLDVTGEAVRQVGQQVTVAVQAIGGLAGAAMTILGRVRATQRLERRAMQVRV